MRAMRNNRLALGLAFVLDEEIGPFKSTAGYVSPERAAQIGDAGGETLAGVARASNPQWAGWTIVDQRKAEPGFPQNLNLDLPVNAELKRLVFEVYGEKYWDRFHCGELPPGLDFCMLDAAVQHLPKTAVSLLQSAVGAQADGGLGPATLAAAQRADRKTALSAYFVARAGLYADLITADSRKSRFRNTWFRRLFNLQAHIIATEAHAHG
jgi:lysozyme family protein